MLERPGTLTHPARASCAGAAASTSDCSEHKSRSGLPKLRNLAGRLASSLRRLAAQSAGGHVSRFREVFDLSSVAMIWATPDGRIIRANQRMAALTGYSLEELESMPYEALLPSEDHDDYRGVLAVEAATGNPPEDRERRYRRKDGAIVWGLRAVTLVVSPSGEQRHKFVMIQDITERRKAEEALFEEQRTLAVLNRTAEKLAAELDLETLLQAVVDAGIELVGAEFGALYSCRKAPGGDGYRLYSFSGVEREAFERLPMARDTALLEPLLNGAAVARWDDVLTDARFAGVKLLADAKPVRSYLVVPLVSRSADVIGALSFGHTKQGIFTERDERLVTGLASHAAIAIEKASLFEAAQHEIERRRRTEASLHESEKRFREFAEVGSDLLWETDDKFRITSIVGDARAVLGLPDEEIIGHALWELANADLANPRWQHHVGDHQAWRPFRNFECQIADRSGATRWISTNGRPYFDRHGGFLGYRGASTNIAASKHVEAKLAASARQQQSAAVLSQLALQRVPLEELYQAAVELASRTLGVELAGIFELSADKRLLRLRAGMGWPSQPVDISAVPLDRCPPLERSAGSDVPVHFSRRNFNLIPGLQDADGAGVAVPIGDRAVRSGILVVCSNGFRAFSESDANFLRSVSFTLAADAEQRKTEATLKLRDRALEAIAEGILITDAAEFDNPLIYVNPAFERITGYSRDEAVGRNGRFLQGGDTQANIVRTIRAAVKGQQTFRGSILNYRKDGVGFWSGLTISPIVDDNGATSHFVGILSDETERMQLESQVNQSQKIESLGQLTGGVAHDFNNLLAVILGNSEILCEEIDDPAMREIAELIMATAEKGADLTQRLLAFGRRQALHPETIDLGKVIGSLSEMLGRTIGGHVTLETRANADRFAYVDRNLLESALVNLVLNARDAMPDGGTLTIATHAVHADDIRTGGLPPGEYVRVSVTDTGAGMTNDVLERAFDPFFTTKSRGKGSGMGLPMVYGFAKQSGGHVTIDTRIGQGTSVHMFLPAAQANEEPKCVGRPRRVPAAGGNERILLVEDEPQLRRFACRQLTGLGYDVLEAEAGAPALDILRSNPEIDLLFTDLLMPGGMSGFDLVRRAREVLPRLKVLLTTGYAAEAENMIANIEEPILKKPYKKRQLAQALRSVLDRAA